jgi:hypothetical protein
MAKGTTVWYPVKNKLISVKRGLIKKFDGPLFLVHG